MAHLILLPLMLIYPVRSVGFTHQTYAYYVNGQNGFGVYPNNAQRLVEDVVNAADTQFPALDFRSMTMTATARWMLSLWCTRGRALNSLVTVPTSGPMPG